MGPLPIWRGKRLMVTKMFKMNVNINRGLLQKLLISVKNIK